MWEGAAWERTSPPPIYLGPMGSPVASAGSHQDSVNPPSLLSILSLRTSRQGEKHRGNILEAESRVNPFAAGWVFASSAPNNPCATQSGASTSGSDQDQDQDQDQLLFLPLSARTTRVPLTHSEHNSHLGTRAFEEQRSPGASRSIPEHPVPPNSGSCRPCWPQREC